VLYTLNLLVVSYISCVCHINKGYLLTYLNNLLSFPGRISSSVYDTITYCLLLQTVNQDHFLPADRRCGRSLWQYHDIGRYPWEP